MKVDVDDLARLIAQDMAEYTEEVEEKVKETIDAVSQEALDAIKSSPGLSEVGGKKYKRGFKIVDEYKARGSHKGFYKLRITNKQYQLTHLLERGHAKRNGGRTGAFTHWANGQKVADTLPDRIKEALK